jgi:hypothetical protein
MKSEWKWFGNAGHLCISNWCCFHLTTRVGEYLVSTVGEYYPPHVNEILRPKAPSDIGYKRLYETMVFKCGKVCECGCGMPTQAGNELAFMPYMKAGEATKGHMKMCEKYDKIA